MVRVVDSSQGWGRNRVLSQSPDPPTRKGTLGITFARAYPCRLARGRYSQPYSLGGSSDVASDYQQLVVYTTRLLPFSHYR